jgi:signal recognition particle subunit SRP54
LICADTYRAGAFDQLKQNAAKAKVPFYGSYTESNPAKVAAEGVALFRKEHFDIIIVDTSGRHKQEKALFDEMHEVYDAVKPHEVIFVLDATIGQAAAMQAAAFKEHVPVGSVIITKLDGHARGGGALSAVAQTGCPITFIGTGEHMHELQPFDTQSFVRRLLGLGDISGLVETIKESGIAQQPELMERLQQGVFTLRDMRDQLMNLMKAGPLSNLMSMLPGIPPEILSKTGNESENQARFKRFLSIMDSMTDAELDSNDVAKFITPQRMDRIARGSGRPLREVHDLMAMFKVFQQSIGRMKNLKLPKGMGGTGPASSMAGMQQQMQAMQRMIDPRLMQQMGGAQGLQSMMKQFAGMDMSSLSGLLGGMGGGRK